MIDPGKLKKFRAEFPHLNSEKIYLDHAAVSPMSNRVRNNILEFIEETRDGIINNYSQCQERKEKVRNQIGQLIKSPEDRIAFVRNTSDGMILLARGLNWKKGDRIIIHREEFPSNVYPWWELKHYGVKIDWMDQPLGHITPDDLERIMRPGTRLVAVSWVQYLSGCRNDLKALASWCHDRNIFLAVDGMQGLGALEFNVEESGVDFLSTGTAKWLMGPHGTGFIYISRELQNMIHPPHLGWISREDIMDFHNYDQPLKENASRYEFATESNIGIYGLNGALEMHLEATPGAIEKQIKFLTDHLVSRFLECGFTVYSPRIDGQWSGIVTITAGSDGRNKQLFKALLDRNVHVSFRGGMLRIAPHFYNDLNDMDRFSEILKIAIK